MASIVEKKETPAERGARLIKEADANRAALSASWTHAMKQMGIQGEPIAPEKLRDLIEAAGVRPEENEFSRAIIAMRGE
jgi:hypothetical protein